VTEELKTRFPATVELALAAMFVAIVFGIPLGFFAAQRYGGVFDHLSLVASLIGISIPIFFLGLILGCIGFLRILLWQYLHIFNYGDHYVLMASTVGCALVGVAPTDGVISRVAQHAVETIPFASDVHVSASLRRRMAVEASSPVCQRVWRGGVRPGQ
jgi:ABC-type dipeptide/oligopeptide/nickel transport system permease component